MTAETFTIRKGDRLPRLFYQFPFSLADAQAVTFSARDSAGVVFINRQAAVIADGVYEIDGVQTTYTPEDGVVFYPWAAPDTATARSAKGLFHIEWPGSLQESLPSEGFVHLSIEDNF